MEVLEISHTLRTLEDLVEFSKVDLTKWEEYEFKPNSWQGIMNRDGASEIVTLYQAKATFRRRRIGDPVEVKQRLDDWIASQKQVPRRKLRRFARGQERVALEVCIYDMHLGKYSTDPEGNVNWDLEIGEKAFVNAVERTIHRAEPFHPEQIVFPIGNDWGHVDSIYGTTTRGTQVANDEVFHQVIQKSQDLLVWAVEEFSKLAPVTVFAVPGNHDYHAAYWLTDFLGAWFRHDENVKVVRGINERRYWRYGKSLVGFHHGSSVRGGKFVPKLDKLPIKMAKEAGVDFAETRFHEWHLGHLHHERLKENTGVYMRGIASLTSFSDAYHDATPFHTPRASEAFLWHHDEGRIAHFNLPYFGTGDEYLAEVIK